MTDFVFAPLVNDPPARVESAALGASNAAKMTDNDIGKAVKLGTANNYVLCATNDEIAGFVSTVEPFTVNGGFSFGGVQRDRRMEAVVGTNQVGAIAIGALVVADTQVALNTAGKATVRSGSPTIFLWRVIRHVTGTGVAGDTVLLEKV